MRSVTIKKDYVPGDKFNYFLCSDLHIDSPGHDRKLLERELSEAIEANADIFIGGDIWDFLLNGDRKRYTPSRNKYGMEDAVVNMAIDEAFNVLKPYAKNIKVMLCGNHESSMTKFHSIDPTVILICRLNELPEVNIEYLGYQGYICLKYSYTKGNYTIPYHIKAHHGTGGSSEITKGTITLNRFMTAHMADMYWNGHTHTKVVLPDENCTYVDRQGNIRVKSRKGVITGAYVLPAFHEPTKRNNRPKPYNVSYGDMKRTLQSTGGVLVTHEFITKEELMTRVIV